jgi:hypothetical protein
MESRQKSLSIVLVGEQVESLTSVSGWGDCVALTGRDEFAQRLGRNCVWKGWSSTARLPDGGDKLWNSENEFARVDSELLASERK